MRCGVRAETPDELLQALFLDGQAKLRARCPTQHEEQCWSTRDERFHASDALVAAVADDLAALEKAGVDVVRCRVAVVCVERLNDAVDRGKSRLDVDLNAMERLVVAARGDAGEDLLATCGKVGGIDRYPSRFDALSSYLVSSIEEGRARSAYRVAGVGEVAFVRDADASNMLVGMASLVGKWVRDAMMERVVRYHQRDVPTAPTVSGYNDPKTARFIDETALSRKTRNMPDRCFERRRIGELPKVLGSV